MHTVELKHEKLTPDFAIYDLNCARGAPMGRPSGVWTNLGNGRQRVEYYNTLPFKLYLNQVPLYDGVYDKGGAYWGSQDNVYVAFCQVWIVKVKRELEVRYYVRAGSREEAKRLVRLELPNASFYR